MTERRWVAEIDGVLTLRTRSFRGGVVVNEWRPLTAWEGFLWKLMGRVPS